MNVHYRKLKAYLSRTISVSYKLGREACQQVAARLARKESLMNTLRQIGLMSRSSENPVHERYGFSGHQTFPFRYGWLKKAIDATLFDPSMFRRDEAIVKLGVGKNMVSSIRHWGLATQVLTQSDRGRVLAPSDWGEALFHGGYDPYLEDMGSLWLLHWLLVTNPARAGVWHLAFNQYPYPEFRKDTLSAFILRAIEKSGIKANPGTIDRDIDCFIRTYTVPRAGKRDLLEDSFSCPFVELGIIQRQADETTLQFNVGPKVTLPAHIVGVVLSDFFDRAGGNRQTLSLQDCVYSVYSPGQVFKLDEESLVDFVEELQVLTKGALTVDETAGLKQLYRHRSLDPIKLLDDYYSESAG